jgi:hypothetical protein
MTGEQALRVIDDVGIKGDDLRQETFLYLLETFRPSYGDGVDDQDVAVCAGCFADGYNRALGKN